MGTINNTTIIMNSINIFIISIIKEVSKVTQIHATCNLVPPLKMCKGTKTTHKAANTATAIVTNPTFKNVFVQVNRQFTLVVIARWASI